MNVDDLEQRRADAIAVIEAARCLPTLEASELATLDEDGRLAVAHALNGLAPSMARVASSMTAIGRGVLTSEECVEAVSACESLAAEIIAYRAVMSAVLERVCPANARA